jgi:hypothetical protein
LRLLRAYTHTTFFGHQARSSPSSHFIIASQASLPLLISSQVFCFVFVFVLFLWRLCFHSSFFGIIEVRSLITPRNHHHAYQIQRSTKSQTDKRRERRKIALQNQTD